MTSHPIINKFYQLSEKSGEIFGNITASFLNAITSITTIGLQGFKMGNQQFIEKVSPAYNNAKDKIGKSISSVIPHTSDSISSNEEITS